MPGDDLVRIVRPTVRNIREASARTRRRSRAAANSERHRVGRCERNGDGCRGELADAAPGDDEVVTIGQVELAGDDGAERDAPLRNRGVRSRRRRRTCRTGTRSRPASSPHSASWSATPGSSSQGESIPELRALTGREDGNHRDSVADRGKGRSTKKRESVTMSSCDELDGRGLVLLRVLVFNACCRISGRRPCRRDRAPASTVGARHRLRLGRLAVTHCRGGTDARGLGVDSDERLTNAAGRKPRHARCPIASSRASDGTEPLVPADALT